MAHEDIPEDRQQSEQCPQCKTGEVTQCDVTGDWACNNCDWWHEFVNEDD